MNRQRGGKAASLAAALVGLALVAAACSSGSTGSKGAGSSSTTTSSSSSTAGTGSSSSPTTPVALKTLVLTPADLPSGWALQSVQGGSPTKSQAAHGGPSCLLAVIQAESSQPSIVATFANATKKSQLSETLVQETSPSQAKRLYQSFAAELGKCQGKPQQLSQGVTLTLTSLTVAGAPRPSTGYRAEIPKAAASAGTSSLIGFKGAIMWVVSISGPGTSTLAHVATVAVGKLGS